MKENIGRIEKVKNTEMLNKVHDIAKYNKEKDEALGHCGKEFRGLSWIGRGKKNSDGLRHDGKNWVESAGDIWRTDQPKEH